MSENKTREWTPDEIAHVLQIAELLRRKGVGQKINVAAFCQEIGLSRKNAYKHKKQHEQSLLSLQQQLEQLRAQHDADTEKIRLLETRLKKAELGEKLRLVMRELIIDYQKKEPGPTPKRRKLLDRCNKLRRSLGLEPLNLWE